MNEAAVLINHRLILSSYQINVKPTQHGVLDM